ncbi:secondary metabolism regulator LAE1 [Colletotrichum spaethianum]|uniref:Secondary metabolism regulator LAE1 n=1 Tax=Colletotrichum spaethianum TaxID=700344 RepID=A0AA37L7F5_9PEZI|nr:secondary metabolism regulator LAE1 [Colletotrichum spaethianum]GKT41994.1 secondary metabolism regulator LAE1 [Colletotrichum spaethianum]
MDQVDHEVVLIPGDEVFTQKSHLTPNMAINLGFPVQVLDNDASELESTASSSTSISSSILNYRLENGRTYHKYKDGNLQHEIITYTLDGELGLAPPCHKTAKVGRVLDVGTGTGIWAIDFGDLHPEAEVLGVDLSPPQQEFVPPNVKFEIDDVEEEWLHSEPFEYIHSRFMTGSIMNWKEYIRRCYEYGLANLIFAHLSERRNSNLAPGGYLELVENQATANSDDGTFPKDCAMAKYIEGIQTASEKLGRAFIDVPKLKNIMEEAGFVDVELRKYKWPMNTWPKEERYKTLGLWCLENFNSALEAVCMALFTRVLNWSLDEVNIFLIDVRKDLKNQSYHAYFNV